MTVSEIDLLRMRCTKFAAGTTISSATIALLKTGWRQEFLDKHLSAALSWASSTRLVAEQEKARKSRHDEKPKRLDERFADMWSAAGNDPSALNKGRLLGGRNGARV